MRPITKNGVTGTIIRLRQPIILKTRPIIVILRFPTLSAISPAPTMKIPVTNDTRLIDRLSVESVAPNVFCTLEPIFINDCANNQYVNTAKLAAMINLPSNLL